MITVFATVFDHASPGFAGFDSLPHIFEGFARHVGMAHDVLWCADQFFLSEAADTDEFVVDVSDVALQIRFRHDGFVIGEDVFPVGDRQVLTHDRNLRCINMASACADFPAKRVFFVLSL